MSSQQGGSFAYPIVGVQTGYDSLNKRWPARKEIDEFMKDGKQAVLFFVGLNIMQTRPMDHTLSFFQLGGIHGFPVRPWPRKGGPGQGSYCEHSNPGGRFATWHRVYMLLFEQALHDIIMELVDPKTSNTISPIPVADRPNWRSAAETWRLPYWDFALRREYNDNNVCIPEVAMTETNPLGDTNSPPTIPTPLIPFSAENPLYAFRYPLKPGETLTQYGMTNMVDRRGNTVLPLSIQQRTVRYATAWRDGNAKITEIWTKGIGDMDTLKEQFQAATTDFRSNLLTVLKDTTTFPQFTMGTTRRGQPTVPDLSNLHGNVHVTTGGWTGDGKNGNMSNVPAAGLDPIFFIYHASIDRLIALWQAGHPDKRNPDNWLPAQDDVSPLWPFLAANGKFWISKDTRDLNALGYTYDGLERIHDVNSLSDYVDELYGDFGPVDGGRSRGGRLDEVPTAPVDAPEYVFTAQYQPNELGPWGIKICLEHDGNTYPLGNIINFVSPPEAKCDNCDQHREEGTTLTSSTFISPALKGLYERGLLGIPEYKPEHIEPLLAAELKWKVVALEDASVEHPIDHLTSLKVGVSRQDKELREELPEPGAPRGAPRGPGIPSFKSPTKVVGHVPLRGITAGKRAGLGEGEHF